MSTSNDWLPELRDDDLDVLMDALEAWESKDLSVEIMGSLVDSMLTSQSGPMPPHVVEERRLEKEQKERDKRLRKERSVLLRAKLLTIRDRRRADHMTANAFRDAP